MYVCMYVFIKLHITTQSGPVILVILYVCMYVRTYVCMSNLERQAVEVKGNESPHAGDSVRCFRRQYVRHVHA